MAGHKDYYKILGVDKSASQDGIKRAYRKLARKVHPDVNPGDPQAEERFKEISEAYHVVGDPERRAAYDRGPERFAQEFDLSDFFQQFNRAFGGHGGAGYRFGGFGDLGGLGDLLGGIFGGQRPGGFGPPTRGGPQAGRDIQVPLELSFEEALKGIEKTVAFRRPVDCHACRGTGRVGSAACSSCGGSGRGSKTAKARVKIPAGITDGSRVRVSGKGEPGSGGGPPGDLYLQIKVAPHRIFRRQGSDLYVDVPVTVYEAALGGEIEVPTLERSIRINLPAGTRNGQVIRLGGKGAPRRPDGKSNRGHLYVTVHIELPEELDEEATELLRRFQREHPYNPRADLSRGEDRA